MGSMHTRRQGGYTIIEVMLFFGITGALMLTVLGSSSLGVNAQRYNDAVNTFVSIVQQEYTNTTNVVNTESVPEVCSGATSRGTSECIILGRIMTIDNNGNMVRANLVGRNDPAVTVAAGAKELEVLKSYEPKIDTISQEKDQMNWGTKIEKGTTSGSYVTMLILRSPRSGGVYSYVIHSASAVVDSNDELQAALDGLPSSNTTDQYICVDRSNWVLSPTRAVKIAAYSSGPSGVSSVEDTGPECD